jgi:glycine cleavage system aminomethyltransferase T
MMEKPTTVRGFRNTSRAISRRRAHFALIADWGPRARELFAAPVTRRRGQPPVLGEWRKAPVSASLGPIDEGVRNGLDMAYRIWKTDADDLREQIDAIRSAGETTDIDVLPLAVDALREFGWLD